MKPHNPDQNQGEGDRRSARRYNEDLRRYAAEGGAEQAAREAQAYVARDPAGAARAEARARRGPRGRRASVDDLLAKSRTLVDRVRPLITRALGRIRARLCRR